MAPSADDPHAEFRRQDRIDGSFPPSSKPRPVAGGIRAHTRRGKFGATWWSRRWIAALEAMAVEDRLVAGRKYARDGQTIALDVELGAIVATVQGGRDEPYAVRIEVDPIGQLEWLQVSEALAGQAIYRTRLLAGDMPDDIEAVFARIGLTLFPRLDGDLRTSCTCADWTPHCRHVAAVFYLAGEAFDRDPFLIFRLRGMEREVLLAMLHGSVAQATGAAGHDGPDATGPAEAADADAPADGAGFDAAALDLFWNGEPGPRNGHDVPPDLRQPPVDGPLVRVLGPLPMWRGADEFEPALRRLQAAAVRGAATDLALGERWPG